MRRRTQIIIGTVIIAWGLLLLLGNLLQINIWNYVWPLILIGIGIWLLTRPHGPNRATHVVLLGDQRRRGPWEVRDESLFCFVGDIHLDLTEAIVPPGETTLHL